LPVDCRLEPVDCWSPPTATAIDGLLPSMMLSSLMTFTCQWLRLFGLQMLSVVWCLVNMSPVLIIVVFDFACFKMSPVVLFYVDCQLEPVDCWRPRSCCCQHADCPFANSPLMQASLTIFKCQCLRLFDLQTPAWWFWVYVARAVWFGWVYIVVVWLVCLACYVFSELCALTCHRFNQACVFELHVLTCRQINHICWLGLCV
jgi:hypothetical protein